jgi:two-component system response regulator AtoC
MVLTDGDVVDCDALPDHIREAGATEQYKSRGISLTDDNLSIKQKARDLEVNLIRRALERTNGNRTHAAKVLEISHRALLYKLKEYGLADL